MRFLIACGRGYVRPGPCKIGALAAEAGMSISGTRTACGEDKIAGVAGRAGLTGTWPRGAVTGPESGCVRWLP